MIRLFNTIEQADQFQQSIQDHLVTNYPRYKGTKWMTPIETSEGFLVKSIDGFDNSDILTYDNTDSFVIGNHYWAYNHIWKCLQAHDKTIYDIKDIPALFVIVRFENDEYDWIPSEEVKIGTVRWYNEVRYECIQAHSTQTGWEPINTPSLWVLDSGEEVTEWVAPTGSHDAYNTGDKVTHNGFTWESTIDANVWAPGVYGWVKI